MSVDGVLSLTLYPSQRWTRIVNFVHSAEDIHASRFSSTPRDPIAEDRLKMMGEYISSSPLFDGC